MLQPHPPPVHVAGLKEFISALGRVKLGLEFPVLINQRLRWPELSPQSLGR